MLDDHVHEALFSDASLMLGEVHGAILKSAHIMDKERWIEVKSGLGSTYEWTEFGNRVGQDEIHWWIFENENDVDQLLAITNEALESAQILKTESGKLKDKEPASYEALLVSLREFAEEHRTEIEVLHKYVTLLAQRHAMAPRILFTYRVWGSTRMADREMKLDVREDEKWKDGILRNLAEIALGVRERKDLVYWRQQCEVGFEIYESLDPEETADNYEIVPPEKTVVRRTARAVYDNCATYFLELRDSLRNIKLDIAKFKQQRELYVSDDFWRTFISKASKVKTAEPQLWDFKETLTMWHVKDESERRKAKSAFAEDVASFANTRGGILIVGVTDRREIVGIGEARQLENRLKFARDVLAEFLEYDREITSLRQIGMGERRDKVCLVIVTSQACSAVGASDGEGRYTYPVRRETGIERVSRSDTPVSKLHLKSDNRDFLAELKQFIRDN
jgi:hypothetical protein